MIFSHMFFCNECGAANPGDALYCFACHQPVDSATAQPVIVAQASVAQLPAPVVPFAAASMQTVVATPLLNNRYEIIREVGQGGFGLVYKTRDTHSKSRMRHVAIKQINLSSLSPRQIIEATDSYNREVTLLSHLAHTNLPRIYDHFTDPEHWYLVMDFIEGETLEEYLKQAGHLPVKETLNVGVQLANVLGYLHSQEPPIIFRDVKPANIMRTPNGQLFLIDFGIARHFNPAKKRDTGALGSPGYAAPEQYGRAQSTEKTDIYGLGATLTTLLLGDDDSKNTAPTPKIPRKLQRLLDHMLESDASKRPKNMQVVMQHLQSMQISWKDVVGRCVRSLVWGLLIGSLPYPVFLLSVLVTRIPFVSMIFGRPVSILAQVLFSLWPLIIVIQLVTAIICLFTPRRRLMGAAIIISLAAFVVAFAQGWLPPMLLLQSHYGM